MSRRIRMQTAIAGLAAHVGVTAAAATATAAPGQGVHASANSTRRGRYGIVTSRHGDRPKNAKRACGVGYIPWPAAGDGAGHLDDGFLIVRNMLPSSKFHRAIQDTTTPGDEAAAMGPYLPKGTYTTKRAFQRKGC
jgi:hypothetical protein